MPSLLHLPIDILTSLLFSASIGIAAGVVAISFSHRLSDGLTFAMLGFALAVSGFGYAIWRSYRPRKRGSFVVALRALRPSA